MLVDHEVIAPLNIKCDSRESNILLITIYIWPIIPASSYNFTLALVI